MQTIPKNTDQHIYYHIIIHYNINIYTSIRFPIQNMQQATQDYEDMFSGMTDQITKNIYIRFYTMQEYFQMTMADDYVASLSCIKGKEGENGQPPESKKVIPVSLIYNRIIQDCIADLYIMNKLIYTKAKPVNSLLDNGRNIANKKSVTWKDFLFQDGFEKVRTAYSLLKNSKKNVIKFAVLSISNLLLKLSINMSKVSVIPIQKLLNFQCLSIPTLSVIMLQYLQYKLFKSKNLTDQQMQITFIKQLPKITFIKLSKYKNNTDIELLEQSQFSFILNQTKTQMKNLQLIQMHHHSIDPIMPNFTRKTKYPYFHVFDLEKMGKGTLQLPYTFQILEIMRQIVFPLVRDFKPDLIVYMESFPSGHSVMDQEIRGLMLCEMAEETTCNKMYVIKELGPDKMDIKDYDKLIKKTEQMSQNTYKGQQISQQFVKIFQNEQTKMANMYLKKLMSPNDKKNIQKMKRVFINQLCFISLALIQKTSFDNVLQKSHKHFFKGELLEGILEQLEDIQKKTDKSEELLVQSFKNRKKGLKMMLQVLKFKEKKDSGNSQGFEIINLFNKQTEFYSFYNLMTDKVEMLQAHQQVGNQYKVHKFSFNQQDNFIVKYYNEQKRTLVIIIKNRIIENPSKKFSNQNEIQPEQQASPKNGHSGKMMQMIFISKSSQQKQFTLQKILHLPAQQNLILNSTYTCSNDFLYRGFGKFACPQPQIQSHSVGSNQKISTNQGYNTSLHRLQIRPTIGVKFQLVAGQGISSRTDEKDEKKVQLEKKIHGYGIFDQDNKSVIMMGGYVEMWNEDRVSKNVYVVKNADFNNGKAPDNKIYVLGKTNKIVYTTSPDKTKQIFLYPFIFGLPLLIPKPPSKPILSILSSNGYYLSTNNNNKIFSTTYKLSQILQYNGIQSQQKLYIGPQLQQAATSIFLSQLLIKCTILAHWQNNGRGNRYVVESLEEGLVFIQGGSGGEVAIVAEGVFGDGGKRVVLFK